MGLLRLLADRRPGWSLIMSMGEETRLSRGELAALARRIEAYPYRGAFGMQVYAGVSLHRIGDRFPGQHNDNALMPGLRSLPLADIRCPTLIVGGTADPHRVHAEFAATMPDAELHWIQGGGHRGLWLNDDCREHQAYTLAWLRERAGQAR